MKVTRAELESLCGDLLDRVDAPIKTVLEAAKMKNVRRAKGCKLFFDLRKLTWSLLQSDVNSLVLVGGSVRVPAVQKILKKTIGR